VGVAYRYVIVASDGTVAGARELPCVACLQAVDKCQLFARDRALDNPGNRLGRGVGAL
jgi:hypothetical protein